MEIVEKKGVGKGNADIVAKSMSSFARYGCNDDARHCYDMLCALKENERPYNYLSALSVYYEKCVSIDSAAVIRIRQFENTGDIETLHQVTKWLAVYYSNKGEYENAAKYAIRHIRVNNTIIKNRDIEGTQKAKNVFIYQRNKEEEMAIMEKAENNRLLSEICVSVSVIAVLLLIVVYVYLRNIMSKKNNDISELECQIEQGRHDIELLTKSKTELLGKLNDMVAHNKMLVEQNCELTKHTIMNELSGDAEDIVKKFKNASKGKAHLTDEDWMDFLAAIDKLYPDFLSELQMKFKRLNEPMLRVCYLWKIKCTNAEIANLTGYPPQTVWDRVKKINELLNK